MSGGIEIVAHLAPSGSDCPIGNVGSGSEGCSAIGSGRLLGRVSVIAALRIGAVSRVLTIFPVVCVLRARQHLLQLIDLTARITVKANRHY